MDETGFEKPWIFILRVSTSSHSLGLAWATLRLARAHLLSFLRLAVFVFEFQLLQAKLLPFFPQPVEGEGSPLGVGSRAGLGPPAIGANFDRFFFGGGFPC